MRIWLLGHKSGLNWPENVQKSCKNSYSALPGDPAAVRWAISHSFFREMILTKVFQDSRGGFKIPSWLASGSLTTKTA